ncbi:DNA mismatch repair endonuclease MutL [Fusobacterium nucleatum]|uniref:DNA mismatch repair protein MutL n=1 Tax=Fusobacterium nucleatum subsp. nucleatum TaxID=76856 RepID=A0A0M4S2U4_FUSNC|nr:DNA mismatch repair endonuclease MutL [Fusobacterium nucleatum]ALF24947.1 DNA mismatch repair protein MutL [Fusobacterium nucleatum subsp. nucleatum]KUL98274.1 DNA mismatch repair protein MutL [Fusobacterium nucleatum subsp. nucleatum]MCG6843092.1 DNA mismatch repair endonuclease MutL [Fusobacterium nucleatum]
MSRIRILDESVSNAIAAGEVVENPTSMIKELIENSLDAGSKEIKLEVWNGGRDISISDSGCGMSKEDLLLSIERHATSKIFTKEDLFNIRTYGFRGEALSSIASVSKMILSSRTEDMQNGTQMNVLGGKVTNLKDIQKNVGTQIEIKDLFYNTPARKKFLRKENTEYLNIKDIFLREALANPNVKFILNIEGKESIKTSGNGIENAILEIFGKNYLKNFSKFSLGYLGNANLFKANRDSIFVFINGRSVKSKIVEEAVIAAYHTKLMKGKYPTALIFLEVEPSEIDVNVHPSKKVVKFANQNAIFDLIKGEIENFFTDDEDFISPYIEAENEVEENTKNNFLDINDFKDDMQDFSQLSVVGKEDYSKKDYNNIKVEKESFTDINKKINTFGSAGTTTESIINLNEIKEDSKNIENFDNSREINDKVKDKYIFNQEDTGRGKIFDDFTSLKNIDFKVIGQVFDTFILVERNGLLEIYDQHIIHERILYEKLKQEYYNHSMSKQNLLVPIRFELDPREKQLALENIEIFSSFGFDIDDFDKNEILLRSIPTMNLRDSYENIFREILDNISKNKDVDIRENIIVSMSCKGAIKANHKLTIEEMYSMVAKLHEVGEYTCPHGRPIIVKMSLLDLEKLFKRK